MKCYFCGKILPIGAESEHEDTETGVTGTCDVCKAEFEEIAERDYQHQLTREKDYRFNNGKTWLDN